MNRETKLHGVLDFLFLILALIGFTINLFLLYRRLVDGSAGIAGCGGGDCDELFASRWSVVFGIPVTAFGAGVYFALLASSTGFLHQIHNPLLGIIAGAAGWFIFVQAVLLHSFCPWCMAAHGVGFGIVVMGAIRMSLDHGAHVTLKSIAVWTITAFLATGLAQVYGPAPATHRIDRLDTPSRSILEGERTAVFDGGGKVYQVAVLPRIGRADAKHILVEYFDYQCPACRMMAGYLDALVTKYPASVGVLLLPVPLERSCNPFVSAENEHAGSCETARIALAVWRETPAAFDSFHHALIEDPSPSKARELALDYLSPEKLDAALKNPWIDALIKHDVSDWRSFSTATDKMPKLLIRDRRILHGLPSGEDDFIRVMEQELGL